MMNALRKILYNLQKYATTVTPVKNDVNAGTPLLPEKRILEETDPDKKAPRIGVNTATTETIDTNACLKEFDDILKEIKNDVTKSASLDDINEVLQDMAQEHSKDIMLEVPRFDLADILAAFENHKDDDIDINSLISLDDSIVSLSDDYIATINEVIEQNYAIPISSKEPEGSDKNISTDRTRNIEQNIDVNSTNTEETKENRKHSESIKYEKLDNNYISADKYQGIEKQTTSNETNEVEAKTNEHGDKNESKDKTNEGFQNNAVESCKEENNLTTKDVFMDDSDDCDYQSSDFEFITEEEAKMDMLILNFKKNTHKRKADKVNKLKSIEVAVDHLSNAKKLPGRNKMKRKRRNIDKDPDWAPGSDTDSISDEEFLANDMEYLSRNNTRSKNNNTSAKSPVRNNSVTFSLRQIRIPPKTNNGSPRYRNLQINSDSLTSRNKTEYNVDVIQINEERDSHDQNNVQEFSNECRNELATIKRESKSEKKILQTDLKTAQINNPNANFNLPVKVPDLNVIFPGCSLMQENCPDSNNMVLKSNEIQDRPDLINIIGPTLNSPDENNVHPGPSHAQRPAESIIPWTSKKNVPDPIMLNLAPSGMQENPGLNKFEHGSSFQNNRSKVDEIEKWRMYQMRARLTGDISDKGNYRPISLATTIAKVLDSMLESMLQKYLILHDAQFGFRPGLSTESAILALKHTVQYYTSRRTPVYACFLDLSKAFDLVCYDVLWEKLRDRGVPPDMLKIFQYWYGNQSNTVK